MEQRAMFVWGLSSFSEFKNSLYILTMCLFFEQTYNSSITTCKADDSVARKREILPFSGTKVSLLNGPKSDQMNPTHTLAPFYLWSFEILSSELRPLLPNLVQPILFTLAWSPCEYLAMTVHYETP